MAYLKDQNKKTRQAGWKRKLVSDEVEQLQKQKLCISNDIEAKIKSAADYAEKGKKCMISPT